MKLQRLLLLLFASCLTLVANAQEVTQGLKLPRLTTAERDLIQKQGDPANSFARGQVIFNLDNACLEFWNSTEWVSLCDKGGGEITPRIPDFPEDLSGDYRLSGKTCFDVKRENDDINDCMPLSVRIDDFASEFSFTYTFSGTESYSDLTFYVTDNAKLVASTSPAGDVFTITFKNDINSLATGTDKTTAKKLTVVAAYKNNIGEDKLVSLEVSVQDCSCGCSVKTVDGGWLTFLCYNLGADKTMTIDQQMAYSSPVCESCSSGQGVDSTVYGGLYQWGRNTDGHQKRTSGMTSDLATTDTPGHSNFITTPGLWDWRTPQNDNLWQPSTGINNPCPAGYRVPTQEEWASIVSGGTTNLSVSGGGTTGTSGNKWTYNMSGTRGFKISPDNGTTTTLFLPTAGYRYSNAGALGYVGTFGFYWASTVQDMESVSYALAFTNTNVNPANYDGRSAGYSVRCVAEN